MSLRKIVKVTGPGVHVPGDDIDTDRIIPARFLKCVTFEGLGEGLFRDLRFDESGRSRNHPVDRPENRGARILVSGFNFGCGSSREHAPQAIYHFGLRAVVAGSFAEIFFGNCTALGIPCVSVPKRELAALGALIEAQPGRELELDLGSKTLGFAGGPSFRFEVPDSARRSLMEGKWDPLGDLLEGMAEVRKVETRLAPGHRS